MRKNKNHIVARSNGDSVGPLQVSYKWTKALMVIMFGIAFLFGVWFVVALFMGVGLFTGGLLHNISITVALFASGGFMLYEGVRRRMVNVLRLVTFGINGFALMMGVLNVLYLIGYQKLHSTVGDSVQEFARLKSFPHPYLLLLGSPQQVHPFFAASSWVAVTMVLVAVFAVSGIALIESHKAFIPNYEDGSGVVVTSVHKYDMEDFTGFWISFYNSSSREVQQGFDNLLFESNQEPEDWLRSYFMGQATKGNFRVALRNGVVVGYLLNSEHFFTVDMLVERPDQRGTGVRKALLDDFKTRALKNRNHRVNMFIREDNISLIELVESEGWKRVGKRCEDFVYSFEKSDLRNAVEWFNVNQNECGVVPFVSKTITVEDEEPTPVE